MLTAGELLRQAKPLIEEGMHSQIIIKGYRQALKMCLDRTLPISMFEKDKGQRSAVTINITGLGQEPTIIDTDAEDVEAKYG